jgi:hypothetical protein
LALQTAAVQRAAGAGQSVAEPSQRALDPLPEALVHRPFFLPAFNGADQQEGLAPVGPQARLGLDPVAHRLPVPGVGDLSGPTAAVHSSGVPTR